MIIVGSDREVIINFDDISYIYVEKRAEKDFIEEKIITSYKIRAVRKDNGIVGIGEYSTRARAREVIKEMSETFIGKFVFESYVPMSTNEKIRLAKLHRDMLKNEDNIIGCEGTFRFIPGNTVFYMPEE